jgi:hypothetical protein
LVQLGTTPAALESKLSARSSPDDVVRLDRCADLVKAEHRLPDDRAGTGAQPRSAALACSDRAAGVIASTVRFASAQGRQSHGQEEARLMKPTSRGIILPGGRPSHC